jgi:hypothetical protein
MDKMNDVKRYRLSYKHGVLDAAECETCRPTDASEPMVLATDYDHLAAENARLREELRLTENERRNVYATIARQAGEIERLKTGDRPCIYAIVQQNGFVLVRATHLTDVGMRLHYVESIPALRPVAAGEEK